MRGAPLNQGLDWEELFVTRPPNCHRGLVEAVFSFQRFPAVEDLAFEELTRVVAGGVNTLAIAGFLGRRYA